MLVAVLALVVVAGAVAGTVRALTPLHTLAGTALTPPHSSDCRSLQTLGGSAP